MLAALGNARWNQAQPGHDSSDVEFDGVIAATDGESTDTDVDEEAQ